MSRIEKVYIVWFLMILAENLKKEEEEDNFEWLFNWISFTWNISAKHVINIKNKK